MAAADEGRAEQPRGDWGDLRLHIVTGKGGTGKTTVAAALALALATGGRRVLLCEVEGRQGIAQLFDTPPLPHGERRVALAPDGGEVLGIAIDPEEALLEYLEMFYRLRRGGVSTRTLRRIGAIDFATTIAPGMRDVLITGKIKESFDRVDPDGSPTFDAVVLDAPPTGRIARFLNVNTDVAGLAKVGPIRSQADSVMRVMRSPRTAVHLVTLLEEMPVQETIDGVAELDGIGIRVGAVIVNMVRRPLLPDAEIARAAGTGLDLAELAGGVKAAGLEASDTTVAALAGEAEEHASRVELEAAQREELLGLAKPTYELPLLPDAVDLGGLYRLAAVLHEQGAA